MLTVAWVDALRRIADKKPAPPLESRVPFNDRHADLFGRPGIDGRLEHHGRSALEVLADGFARSEQGSEIRLMRLVHRCWYRNDDEVRLGEVSSLGRHAQTGRGPELCLADFPGRVAEAAVRGDFSLGKIEADGRMSLSELNGQGQAHVSQANHGNDGHFDSLRGVCAQRARRRSVPVISGKGTARCTTASSAAQPLPR